MYLIWNGSRFAGHLPAGLPSDYEQRLSDGLSAWEAECQLAGVLANSELNGEERVALEELFYIVLARKDGDTHLAITPESNGHHGDHPDLLNLILEKRENWHQWSKDDYLRNYLLLKLHALMRDDQPDRSDQIAAIAGVLVSK